MIELTSTSPRFVGHKFISCTKQRSSEPNPKDSPQTPVYVKCYVGLLCLKIVDLYVILGKAIPLQTLTGPEGSRRLRLPDFKTIGT
jgi:hypothetical protein